MADTENTKENIEAVRFNSEAGTYPFVKNLNQPIADFCKRTNRKDPSSETGQADSRRRNPNVVNTANNPDNEVNSRQDHTEEQTAENPLTTTQPKTRKEHVMPAKKSYSKSQRAKNSYSSSRKPGKKQTAIGPSGYAAKARREAQSRRSSGGWSWINEAYIQSAEPSVKRGPRGASTMGTRGYQWSANRKYGTTPPSIGRGPIYHIGANRVPTHRKPGRRG